MNKSDSGDFGDRTRSPGNATVTTQTTTAWNDPSVPAGEAPPRSAGQMILAGGAWLIWMLFLLAMMVIRMRTAPV